MASKDARIRTLEAQLEIATAALRHYANRIYWSKDGVFRKLISPPGRRPIIEELDEGYAAREALKLIEAPTDAPAPAEGGGDRP